MLTDRIVLDKIKFGIRESELGHRGYGTFAPGGPRHPQNIFKGPTYCVYGKLCGETHNRDFSEIVGFEMWIPQGKPLDNLILELDLRRWSLPEYREEIKPCKLYMATPLKIYFVSDFFLPLDERWHTFSFNLSKVLPGVFECPNLTVFVDNHENLVDAKRHSGCSIALAKLSCASTMENLSTCNHLEEDFGYTIDGEVLCVVCPVWDIEIPPISLGGIASYLESKNIAVSVLDLNILWYNEANEQDKRMWGGINARRWRDDQYHIEVKEKYRQKLLDVTAAIARTNVRVIAFSVYSTNMALTIELARMLKEGCPEKIIVFGGPETFVPPPGIGHDWDYLVVGDGEVPLYRIVTNDLDNAPGIVSRRDYHPGKDITVYKYAVPDLNEMPLLHFDRFPLNSYKELMKLPVYTSRGCLRRCGYCFDSNYYHPYRFMKGPRAFEHFMNLHEKHGRTYLELSDLLLNGNLDAVLTMSNLLAKESRDLSWGGFAIIRNDMDHPFFDSLKTGGCDYMRYGFETGCRMHLKSMGRGYSLETASKVFRMTHNAGIKVRINILVGFPGETDETVQETIDYLRENREFIDSVDTVNTITLMHQTDLEKNQARYEISMGKDGWKTPEHDQARRRQWAFKMIESIKTIGIHSKGGMIELGDDHFADVYIC